MVAELSHAQKNLYDVQTQYRQIEQKLDKLKNIEQQVKTVEARLLDKETQNNALDERLNLSIARESVLTGQLRELELALATSEAKMAAQQGVVADLRSYLVERDAAIGENTKRI